MLTVLSHSEISAASTLTVMALTRIERNQIYEAIAASNLDPAECSINQYDLEPVTKVEIRHNNSGSTFEFHPITGMSYRVTYNVIDGHNYTYDTVRNIKDLTLNIRRWGNEVKLTAETPDLWAELWRSRQFVVDIMWADTSNTPFTKDEQSRIAVQLEAFTEHVKERFDLNSEQTAHIEEWRDEVTESSERLGRKDWKLLAYGTIVNLVVTDAVTPEVARHIFIMLIQGIVHLIGGSEPPQILA